MALSSDEKDVAAINSVLQSVEIEVNPLDNFLPTPCATLEVDTENISAIDNALDINRLIDNKLKLLENMFVNRLQECRRRLRIINYPTPEIIDNTHSFIYLHCGKPYFKDKKMFAAPRNHDAEVMAKSDILDLSLVVCQTAWTVRDKEELNKVILDMSRSIQEKKLKRLLADCEIQYKKNKCESMNQEIKRIKKKIAELPKLKIADLALPINEDYDWELVSHTLDGRHTAKEYKAIWNLFLHPDINKTPWNKGEEKRLVEIAQKYNLHNWELIAKELGSQRTGYQCFVYYRTNLSKTNTFIGKKWSSEEEEYLRRLVMFYQEDSYIPWGKIASKIPNRTKVQIYSKYIRLNEKKGRFTKEEDTVLLTSVKMFGQNFKKIAKYSQGRSAQQLRQRYNVLQRNTISTVWTIEEDKRLIQMMSCQEGGKLMNFARLVDYFPGKSRENLRTRYQTLIKWMGSNRNVDIANAPRRGARRLGHGHEANDLRLALENLKNTNESPPQQKSSTRKHSLDEVSEGDIEDAVTAVILNDQINTEAILDAQSSAYHPSSVDKTNLRKILILLKAQLDKEHFVRSKRWVQRYPSLLVPDDVSIVTNNSYSRVNVNRINLGLETDIWGSKTLKTSQYVLPPHFATIAGCRKLITYVAELSTPKLSINQLCNRSKLFKEQWNLLLDRFITLFLWPMILSNNHPRMPIVTAECPNEKRRKLNLFTSTRRQKEKSLESEDTGDISHMSTSDEIS